MVEIEIKLKDEKFRKDMDALQAVIPEINERSLGKAAAFVAGRVQSNYLRGPRPDRLEVRTARLIGSIQSETKRDGKDTKAYVGSNAVSKEGYNYPGYWEYDGSKHGGPRPFLSPAVEENADKWINIWIGELKKRLEAWLSARAF
jgi:HK97 gp10 family phage protein